ncbi:hypothetical protein QQG55_42030 [Brugia pahangi]
MGNATSSVACAAGATTIVTDDKNKKGRFEWKMWCSEEGHIDRCRGGTTRCKYRVSVEDVAGSVDDCERVPISSETIHEVLSLR